MSFQQTYRSASNPVHSHSASQSSVNRKPATYASSFRSVSPLPPSNHQQSTTAHPQPVKVIHTPTPSTPLSSFPPRAPISPSITPEPSTNSLRSSEQPSEQPTTLPSPSPATLQHNPSGALKLMNPQEIDNALQACLRVQQFAVTEHGKRPFAALLLGPDNVTVLASHNSLSHYQHAESELARLAGAQYSQKYLEKCTLVSTWEPCAMCAGTIYWTGIGRVLYAASEMKLKEITGSNNEENLTMSLPCRSVFDAGQRKVEILGPIDSWEQKVLEESGRWWRNHQASSNVTSSARSPASVKENGSIQSKRTSVTIYNPDESLLGSIGEDGEYQADLKVDWMR